MATGTVKWFNADKGYGFITPDDGSDDLMAYFTDIQTESKTLADGQKVKYDVLESPKGPLVRNITPL